MNVKFRMMVKIALVVIGVALIIYGRTGAADEFWSGMGAGLAVVGALQLFRLKRYRTDPQYRADTDTEIRDERNRFLSMKAWSWAGYCFVMIAAVGVIVLKILGREEMMAVASGSVCLMLLLYWGSWLILRKKY